MIVTLAPDSDEEKVEYRETGDEAAHAAALPPRRAKSIRQLYIRQRHARN
jgi:hypothetical protein